MKVYFRDAIDEDRAFIVSTWATSYRDSYSAGILSDRAWHRVMREQINEYLDRSDMCTIVAYDPSAAARRARADIFGYIVGSSDPRYVAWVYVKDDVRKAGIGKWLFAELGIDPTKPFEYACKTAWAAKLKDKAPHAIWNPMRLRRPEERAA